MPVYDVKLPLGCVRVDLDRRGLQLGDRGGFVACWLSDAANTLDEASFRECIKAYLNAVYEAQSGRSAPKVLLNLATHQLLEDIIGWTRLNHHTKPEGDRSS